MTGVRVAVLAVALLMCGVPGRVSALSVRETKATATVLSRFETLLFVAGQLAVERPDLESLSAVDTVRAPLAYVREALELAAPGSAGPLFGEDASVLVGAKDFRAP